MFGASLITGIVLVDLMRSQCLRNRVCRVAGVRFHADVEQVALDRVFAHSHYTSSIRGTLAVRDSLHDLKLPRSQRVLRSIGISSCQSANSPEKLVRKHFDDHLLGSVHPDVFAGQGDDGRCLGRAMNWNAETVSHLEIGRFVQNKPLAWLEVVIRQLRPHESVDGFSALPYARIEAVVAHRKVAIIPFSWPLIADDAAFPCPIVGERQPRYQQVHHAELL